MFILTSALIRYFFLSNNNNNNNNNNKVVFAGMVAAHMGKSGAKLREKSEGASVLNDMNDLITVLQVNLHFTHFFFCFPCKPSPPPLVRKGTDAEAGGRVPFQHQKIQWKHQIK
jgi:hypothetical protein